MDAQQHDIDETFDQRPENTLVRRYPSPPFVAPHTPRWIRWMREHSDAVGANKDFTSMTETVL